jgi:hypothetical protein
VIIQPVAMLKKIRKIIVDKWYCFYMMSTVLLILAFFVSQHVEIFCSIFTGSRDFICIVYMVFDDLFFLKNCIVTC